MEIDFENTNQLNSKDESPSLENDTTSKKISEILSQYENGVESIFSSSKKEEENYFFLLFSCPDSFHQKYSSLNKNNSSSSNQSTTLKFFREMEKKTKTPELNNEKQYSRLNSISNKDNIEINIEEENNKYIIMLRKIFEKFFGTNESLLEGIIKKYLTLNKLELKKEFDYEDFILIFCSIIKYYSGLNISLELNEFENYLLIFIYGDDNSYTNICKMLNYQLQLKPIAIDYEKNQFKFKKKDSSLKNSFKDIEIIDYNDQEPLLQSFNNNQDINNLQYEDYDINNPIFWPPYYTYKPEKDDKFRDYEANDDFYFGENNVNKYN